ncbi:glutaredoxin family protein [Methanoculleus chikugoensis]|uniref:glutaredoxin family protein n=1 Tax=Methanoculleus chikugoensis TaxID=118126 RepID=UPI000A6D3490|nr:glutaredoxin family protein [Methanoculleus chikugoensis]
MAGVKVYTTENCPYCRMVQAFLRKHDVEFEIVDVGKDREAAREMIAISGGQRGGCRSRSLATRWSSGLMQSGSASSLGRRRRRSSTTRSLWAPVRQG